MSVSSSGFMLSTSSSSSRSNLPTPLIGSHLGQSVGSPAASRRQQTHVSYLHGPILQSPIKSPSSLRLSSALLVGGGSTPPPVQMDNWTSPSSNISTTPPMDRFIPERCAHEASATRNSMFYSSTNENTSSATPTSALLRSPEHRRSSALRGSPRSSASATKSVVSPLHVATPPAAAQAAIDEETLSHAEPYTQVLARTLFPASQSNVLALHQPNVPVESEETRFSKSFAVVYGEKKAQHFLSRNFRIIAQTPERILDAPELLDDFYLNLVDWSSTNNLTVALGSTVYIWNAASGAITQLMSTSDRQTHVTSVSWHSEGTLLAIGTDASDIQIWDTNTKTLVQTQKPHAGRVVSLSWNGSVLASGSRDATVALSDIRESRPFSSLTGHTQEVCGLRWSPNGQQLASGGNDNLLLIWDFNKYTMECTPLFSLKGHTAAVKAIAWNPVQPHLLASGGGTADKCLKFWNTSTGECLQSVNTKSQVCGILWSRCGSELVSSHGYSDHQLTVWKYPTLRKVTDLLGHTSRVLHLAMSPDGEVVVSAAGDETIRFWRCFAPTVPHSTTVSRVASTNPAVSSSSSEANPSAMGATAVVVNPCDWGGAAAVMHAATSPSEEPPSLYHPSAAASSVPRRRSSDSTGSGSSPTAGRVRSGKKRSHKDTHDESHGDEDTNSGGFRVPAMLSSSSMHFFEALR